MERAREIWEELELPKLTPRPPWSGYSLGMWPEEAIVQAENAVAGNHAQNAEYSARKGIKVPRGAKFMDLKKKYMADEIERLKQQVGESDEHK
jgi:4-hydroxy-3-polyprenylbenzoate decarboxylase